MKISAISQIHSPINKINKVNNKKQTEQNQINKQLSNNTLSEAIGRSQVVSFSGTNKNKSTMFEHECSELFGDREHIIYNKQTGSFKHQIFAKDGTLKSQEEFYPEKNTEITTKISEQGIKTVTRKTPTYTSVEKTNADGNQIYFEEADTNGNSKKIVTDFQRGRKVFYTSNDGRETVKVFDIKANEFVTTGDLVIDRTYDKNLDIYFTRNIITGQVLREEKYKPNGKLEYQTDYSPKTNKKIKKIVEDREEGGYHEYTYNDYGVQLSYKRTSKNGRNIRVMLFHDDGKTIRSDVEFDYARNGKLEYKTKYTPNTGIIEEETSFDTERPNSYTVYFYKPLPNVPVTAEYYDAGELTEELRFQKDGKTLAFMRKHHRDGSRTESIYNEKGIQESTKYFDKNNFLYLIKEYNFQTGILTRRIDYDKESGCIVETHYNEATRKPKKQILRASDNTIKQYIEYYSNGTKERKVINYNNDGSYSATLYDEDGNILQTGDFNADGTRKQTRRRTNYQDNTSQSASKKPETQDEFYSRIISHLAHNNKKKIDEEDWITLANLLGVDDPDKIKNISKDTYRKLASIYYPDLHPDNEEICTKILQILNILYHEK